MPTLQKPDLKKGRLFSMTTTLIVDTLVFGHLSLRRNKKQTAVINIKLYLDVSYVPTYIFRIDQPLNNNRNFNVE